MADDGFDKQTTLMFRSTASGGSGDGADGGFVGRLLYRLTADNGYSGGSNHVAFCASVWLCEL